MENEKTNQSCHFKKVIGIDPGKSGGLTVMDKNGIVTKKCPDGTYGMATVFGIAVGDTAPIDIYLIMERVWARPTNGSRHAFAYGVNYGQWLGIAAAHDITMNTVIPQTWMKEIGCPKGMEVQERKRWLKDMARTLYPNLKGITLKTADSVLIAHINRHQLIILKLSDNIK